MRGGNGFHDDNSFPGGWRTGDGSRGDRPGDATDRTWTFAGPGRHELDCHLFRAPDAWVGTDYWPGVGHGVMEKRGHCGSLRRHHRSMLAVSRVTVSILQVS